MRRAREKATLKAKKQLRGKDKIGGSGEEKKREGEMRRRGTGKTG